MNFKEYTEKAKSTILFKNKEETLFCTMSGLFGELAEYIEHYYNDPSSDLTTKELGDICWYMAIISDYFNIKPEKIAIPYRSVVILQGIECHNEPNLIDDGFITLGKLAEILKKMVRVGNWRSPDDTNLFRIKYYIDSFYTLIVKESNDSDLNLSDVLSQNIEKLYDRKKRNTIHGNGDKR